MSAAPAGSIAHAFAASACGAIHRYPGLPWRWFYRATRRPLGGSLVADLGRRDLDTWADVVAALALAEGLEEHAPSFLVEAELALVAERVRGEARAVAAHGGRIHGADFVGPVLARLHVTR